MITNGYLLNKEILDFIINMKVSFIQVTIDGPKEIHDKRRCLKSGGGSYDRILSNLSNIKEDTPLNVDIRINVDKRNEKNIPDLLEDLKSYGLHQQKNVSINFGHVHHSGTSCPDISTQCMITPEFSNFLVKAYETATMLGFRITNYPSLMLGSCGAVGSGSGVIEPNGNIQNCWETVGMEEKKTGVLGKDGIKYYDNYLKWIG